MSVPPLSASAAAAEAAVKTTIPVATTERRPSRSVSRPAGSSSAPKLST